MEEEDKTNEQSPEAAEEISANPAVDRAHEMLENTKTEKIKDKKSMRNKIIFLLLAIILALVGYLVLGSDSSSDEAAANDDSTTSESASESSAVNDTVIPKDFDQIVYSHASTDSSARDLFSRPVTGGDRVELSGTFGPESVQYVSRDGDAYVVANSNGEIFYGEGTTEPTKIYTTSDQVLGVYLDKASASVAVATLTDIATTPAIRTIYSVPTNGGDAATFFTETGGYSGLFVEHWDGDANVFIGRRSCYQCDGYNSDLIKIDAEGKETAVYDSGGFAGNQTAYQMNTNGTKALFFEASTYTDQEIADNNLIGGIDEPIGAPFTLMVLDTTTGQTTDIATVGSIDDAINGFFAFPITSWANTDSGQTIAYSYLKKLFVQNGNGSFDNYFETGQSSISTIYSVDEDEVLVGSRNDDGETLSYFNIDTQKGSIVMETLDNLTTVLSVTLK